MNYKLTNKQTFKDKFYAVLETATLNEKELAQYCRRKGIYLDKIKKQKQQCLKANLGDPQSLKINFEEEKDKNKKLEKPSKKKALAEPAALLILRKKANTIWRTPKKNDQ